jgi:hypothetical protein
LDDWLDWQQRLASQKASGLSIEFYCLQEGVSRSTFYRWQQQLKNGVPAALLEAEADRQQAESEEVSEATFLPVSLQASPVEIELPYGGVELYYKQLSRMLGGLDLRSGRRRRRRYRRAAANSCGAALS